MLLQRIPGPLVANHHATLSGWILLDTQTVSGASALTFTSGINSVFSDYMITLDDLRPDTDGESLWMRVSDDGGSTYEADATDYEYNAAVQSSGAAGGPGASANSQGDTKMIVTSALSNASGEGLTGTIRFSRPADTGFHTFDGDVRYWNNGTPAELVRGMFLGAHNGSTLAIDAIQLLMSTGNISGTARLYGLRK